MKEAPLGELEQSVLACTRTPVAEYEQASHPEPHVSMPTINLIGTLLSLIRASDLRRSCMAAQGSNSGWGSKAVLCNPSRALALGYHQT